jgi:hypothetical protein
MSFIKKAGNKVFGKKTTPAPPVATKAEVD